MEESEEEELSNLEPDVKVYLEPLDIIQSPSRSLPPDLMAGQPSSSLRNSEANNNDEQFDLEGLEVKIKAEPFSTPPTSTFKVETINSYNDNDYNYEIEPQEGRRVTRSSTKNESKTLDYNSSKVETLRFMEGVAVEEIKFKCEPLSDKDEELLKPVKKQSKKASLVSLSCGVCKQSFKSMQCLNLHMESNHNQDNRPNCKICKKSFASKRNLKKHQGVHSKNKKEYINFCSICDKPFSTANQVTRHEKTHMSPQELRDNKINTFQCYFCQQIFFTWRDLEDHSHRHTKLKPYFCPNCPKTYMSHGTLRIHLNFNHSGDGQRQVIRSTWKFPCPHCHKKFRAPSDLAIHLPRHDTKKNFLCTHSDCGKSFKFKPELSAHLKIHLDDCPFVCSICLHRTTSKWKLTQHLTSHSNKKKFTCPESGCAAAFKQKTTLDKHVRIVHEDQDFKPWVCTFKKCKRSFREKSGLTQHERYHYLEESPFSCKICGKKYVDQKRLDGHIKTHSGRKDFVCSWPGCGMAYTERANLSRHQRITHEGMRKACPMPNCEQSFTVGTGLKYHLFSAHGIADQGKPCLLEGCEEILVDAPCLKYHLKMVHKLDSKFDSTQRKWITIPLK